MIDLPNIERAAGLDDARREILSTLMDRARAVAGRNLLLKNYYEGDHVPADVGVDTVPPTVNVLFRCDWPAKAVTSVSERVRFDGFVFDGGYRDDSLERAMRANSFDLSFNRHVASELVTGCMFATVGRLGNGAQIRFHTADTAVAEWDYANSRVGAGLVIASTGLTPWSARRQVVTQVNMHLQGEVDVIRRTGPSSWSAETLRTAMDRPMMEAFSFRPTGVKPFGVSRITKTVQDLSDQVSRTLRNMAVSSALYAAPQKYLLGLTDEQFDAISKDKWSAYVGSILLATRDENGDVPSFGQLSAASPQPYIDAIRAYAMLFSGATGVPLNSLGIIQDNPSSAEAIGAAREDICIAAEDLIASNGEGLRNVALMAMAVENNTTMDGLTPEQTSVVPHFRDPSMPSIVSQADAMVKIAAVAPWITESEVFSERLGFDEATRNRLAADKAKAEAREMLAVSLAADVDGA